jgi:hypothetical protein
MLLQDIPIRNFANTAHQLAMQRRSHARDHACCASMHGWQHLACARNLAAAANPRGPTTGAPSCMEPFSALRRQHGTHRLPWCVCENGEKARMPATYTNAPATFMKYEKHERRKIPTTYSEVCKTQPASLNTKTKWWKVEDRASSFLMFRWRLP